MTEYIIIVALVAIASIAVVTIFGDQIRSMFSDSVQELKGEQASRKGGGDSTGAIDKDLKNF